MKYDLLEARSHADKNPYITALEYLEPYKDRDDIFISFRSIPKLGINPIYQYATPTGIYAYPLREKFEELKKTGKLEFATDRPYIAVFQNTSKHILNRNASKNDLQQCYKILKDDNPMIKRLKYKALCQNWRGYKIQDIISVFKGELNMQSKNTRVNRKSNADLIDEILNGKKKKIQPNQNGEMDTIWNLVRNTAIFNAYLKGKLDSTWLSNEWGRLFMLCGYDCAIDYGDSIIHPAEPIQAVFFSIKPIKMIDMLTNDIYSKLHSPVVNLENLEKLKNVLKKNGQIKGKTVVDQSGKDWQLKTFRVEPKYIVNAYFNQIEYEANARKSIYFEGCKFNAKSKQMTLKKCILDHCKYNPIKPIVIDDCEISEDNYIIVKRLCLFSNCTFKIPLVIIESDVLDYTKKCDYDKVECVLLQFNESTDLFKIQKFLKENKSIELYNIVNCNIDDITAYRFTHESSSYKKFSQIIKPFLLDDKHMNNIVEWFDKPQYKSLGDNRFNKIVYEYLNEFNSGIFGSENFSFLNK